MNTFTCKQCGKTFERQRRRAIFCSVRCKAEWQKTQKPVDESWLRQKYLNEGLGAYQIAGLVDRNPKQVWHWLKGYDIPIRERDWNTEADPAQKPYHDPDWLRWEYLLRGRSSADIAQEFDVTPANIIYFLKKFDIPRRTTSETRALKHWGAPGEDNPMYGVRGEDHPAWKGGCTPERQTCYSSQEWLKAAAEVRKRDKERCQRCGAASNLHIHHIVSFAIEELRTEPSNLILLCESCHHWTHSSENTKQEYIKEWKGGDGG